MTSVDCPSYTNIARFRASPPGLALVVMLVILGTLATTAVGQSAGSDAREEAPWNNAADTAAVVEAFASLAAELAHTPDSLTRETVALDRARRLLSRAQESGQLGVMTAAVRGINELARGMKDARQLYHVASAAGRRFEIPAGTRAADKAGFWVALSNVELERSDFHGTRRYLDSVLLLPRASLDPRDYQYAIYTQGYMHFYEGNLERALPYFIEASEPSVPLADKTSAAVMALDAVTSMYVALERPALALQYGEEAVRAVSAEPDPARRLDMAESNVYLNYAEALLLNGRHAEATQAAQRSLELLGDGADAGDRADVYVTKAKIAVAEGRFDQAEAWLAECRGVFHARERFYDEAQVLTALARLRIAQERPYEAFDLLTAAHHLQDSLTREGGRSDLAQLVRSYEASSTEQRLTVVDARAKQLAAENRSHRYQRALLLAALLLCVGTVGYFSHRLRRRGREQAVLEQTVLERTAALSRSLQRVAEGNADLESFAYIASHDLKTPLRNVTSFLDLIDRRLPPSARAPVGEYLTYAKGYAQQMNRLIGDVLTFAQVHQDVRLSPKRIPLQALLTTLGETLRAAHVGRPIDFRVDGEGETLAPVGPVKQVFEILLANAVLYNQQPVARVDLGIRRVGEQIHVEVRDNGIGIAAEYHEQVFALFKRLHTIDEYPGTGLGLALARRIATRLGGEISVASALGEGSVFTVTLPVDTSQIVRAIASQEGVLG